MSNVPKLWKFLPLILNYCAMILNYVCTRRRSPVLQFNTYLILSENLYLIMQIPNYYKLAGIYFMLITDLKKKKVGAKSAPKFSLSGS